MQFGLGRLRFFFPLFGSLHGNGALLMGCVDRRRPVPNREKSPEVLMRATCAGKTVKKSLSQDRTNLCYCTNSL